MSQKTRIARLYSYTQRRKGALRIVQQDIENDGAWLETVDGEQVSLTYAELKAAEQRGDTIIRIVYVDNWRE